MSDGRMFGAIDRQVRAQRLSPFIGQRFRAFVASENAGNLAVIRELVDAGQVAPVIHPTDGLPDAAAAMRSMMKGRVRGKLVITM
ncbi:MAG: zinc-binding dehydrogenase [Actinomycetota bacterium]|nr:zinc-binding dehydrogenase [Actinomycetota bacterium]